MPVTYSNRALEGRSNVWKYSTHNMGQSQTHLEQPPSNHKKMVTTTPLKYGNMGVTTGKKMTMAGALIGEKLAHLRADMRFGLYRLSHPLNDPNVRIVAAQESTIAQKSVATGMFVLPFIS